MHIKEIKKYYLLYRESADDLSNEVNGMINESNEWFLYEPLGSPFFEKAWFFQAVVKYHIKTNVTGTISRTTIE